MWKRAFKRVSTNIKVRFFSGTKEFYGTIANLSEKGMFIKTKVSFPLQPQLRILIPRKADILWTHAMIKSFGISDNIYSGIGVELLGPSQKYLEFIGGLRTVEKSLK